MGLHIYMVCAEKFPGPLNSKPFNNISVFAAAVIPLIGISFCILVGKNRTLCFHYRTAGIILGSYEQYFALFPQYFLVNCIKNFRITLFKLLEIHRTGPNLIPRKISSSENPLSLLFFLNNLYFFQPVFVSSSLERSNHPCFHYFCCKVFAYYSASEDQDVCIIMESAHFCRKQFIAKCCTDVAKFICNYGHADTGAAYQNPAVGFSL